jgi:hypothetical protein
MPLTLRRLRLEAAVRRTALQLHAQHLLHTDYQLIHSRRLQERPVRPADVRILRCPPAGFGRFCIAAFGASPPIGSPSMSRTSRPEAIATLYNVEPVESEDDQRALVMDLQGC